MRLFIAGDTHGNLRWWLTYLLPQARLARADAIVQVGDFGFWEHEPSGVEFLDELDEAAADAGLIIYVLHGNHDNWSNVWLKYHRLTDSDEFVIVRSHIRYIPQGHVWTWDGLRMRAFGGAYSIDKQYRLDLERKRQRAAFAREEGRRQRGLPAEPVKDHAGTIWFPTEEATPEEWAQMFLDDSDPLDIVFSHDKPRRSNPMMDLKNILECHPNQNRLQAALDVHRPAWWFHGHLHHLYVDTVMTQDAEGADGAEPAISYTRVVGLSCDDEAAMRGWRPSDSWCLLETAPNRAPRVLFPPDMQVMEVAE